jgi:hypothetical protein
VGELLLRRRYPSAPRTATGRLTTPVLDDYLRPGAARPDHYAELRQGLQEPVGREAADYARQVDEEFDELPLIVQVSFHPLAAEPYATSRQKYHGLRPAYYRAGWRCPKQVFDRIKAPSEGAVLLGYPIAGGIHEELLAVFAKLPAALDAREPGLADRVRQQVFSIGGFVPRVVEGSAELSNHAFGLAVDLDPDWNPQFKGAEVLAVLKRVTGFDFGRTLYPASAEDRIGAIAAQIERASARLKAWLATALPAWETGRAGLRGLQATLAAAKTAADRRQAAADLKAAQAAFDADPDRHGVDVLVRAYTERTVRGWAAYGIQTIPKELVEEFKKLGAAFGARWGGEYDTTKDGMHLELLAHRTIPRTSRPVQNLTDLEAGPPPPAPGCAGPGPGAEGLEQQRNDQWR